MVLVNPLYELVIFSTCKSGILNRHLVLSKNLFLIFIFQEMKYITIDI